MRPYRAIPIGKPIKSENFVYGWYALEPEVGAVILTDIGETYDSSPLLVEIPVIESTVGQATGLCDKNGKEIYEGDKLRSTATKVANPSIKICEWEGIGFDPFVADCEHSGDGWHWEIVGNIHAETEE
ncbi:hypothetical protein LCGC14_1436330 [marine sediment metagenome]|uniref:YopX protein domain-containing protein n=1 Tax=marine sediment metagenome TaxID=412755 RepID=A0A0F9JML6_9ZZZZ